MSSADTSNFVMPLRFENFQGIEVAVRPGLQTVNQLLRHNYNADQHMSNETNVQVEQKDREADQNGALPFDCFMRRVAPRFSG